MQLVALAAMTICGYWGGRTWHGLSDSFLPITVDPLHVALADRVAALQGDLRDCRSSGEFADKLKEGLHQAADAYHADRKEAVRQQINQEFSQRFAAVLGVNANGNDRWDSDVAERLLRELERALRDGTLSQSKDPDTPPDQSKPRAPP